MAYLDISRHFRWKRWYIIVWKLNFRSAVLLLSNSVSVLVVLSVHRSASVGDVVISRFTAYTCWWLGSWWPRGTSWRSQTLGAKLSAFRFWYRFYSLGVFFCSNPLAHFAPKQVGVRGPLFTPTGVSNFHNNDPKRVVKFENFTNIIQRECLKTKIWYSTGVCLTFEDPTRGCTWGEKRVSKGRHIATDSDGRSAPREVFPPLCNLTGASAALLPRRLSNSEQLETLNTDLASSSHSREPLRDIAIKCLMRHWIDLKCYKYIYIYIYILLKTSATYTLYIYIYHSLVRLVRGDRGNLVILLSDKT